MLKSVKHVDKRMQFDDFPIFYQWNHTVKSHRPEIYGGWSCFLSPWSSR